MKRRPVRGEITPEEVEQRKAEVQARWSESERERRRVTKDREWEVQIIDAGGLDQAGENRGLGDFTWNKGG